MSVDTIAKKHAEKLAKFIKIVFITKTSDTTWKFQARKAEFWNLLNVQDSQRKVQTSPKIDDVSHIRQHLGRSLQYNEEEVEEEDEEGDIYLARVSSAAPLSTPHILLWLFRNMECGRLLKCPKIMKRRKRGEKFPKPANSSSHEWDDIFMWIAT